MVFVFNFVYFLFSKTKTHIYRIGMYKYILLFRPQKRHVETTRTWFIRSYGYTTIFHLAFCFLLSFPSEFKSKRIIVILYGSVYCIGIYNVKTICLTHMYTVLTHRPKTIRKDIFKTIFSILYIYEYVLQEHWNGFLSCFFFSQFFLHIPSGIYLNIMWKEALYNMICVVRGVAYYFNCSTEKLSKHPSLIYINVCMTYCTLSLSILSKCGKGCIYLYNNMWILCVWLWE